MKVICIGNVTYDITIPFNGFIKENTKYRVKEKIECGGGPASNAAYLLGKWGIKPYFAGLIGNDEFGKKIIKEFEEANVNLKYLDVRGDYNTTTSIIINNQNNGSRTIIACKPENFKMNNIEDEFDIILVDGQEYETSYNLIKKSKGISIIDAGRNTKEVIELAKICDYVVCSKSFGIELTGYTDYTKMYEKLEETFKGIIVVTLEEEGSIVKIDGKIKIIPSIKVKPLDTTGAGDFYHGAFVYGLIQKWNIEEIIKFSNIVGALSTLKVGTRNSVVSLEQINEYR